MRRPTGITVSAVVAFIGGALGLFAALPMFGVTIDLPLFAEIELVHLEEMAATDAGIWWGIALAAGGALQLLFGISVLMLERFAWPLGVGTFMAVAILDAVMLVQLELAWSAFVGIALAAGVLTYLYTDTAREALDHMPGAHIHPSPA